MASRNIIRRWESDLRKAQKARARADVADAMRRKPPTEDAPGRGATLDAALAAAGVAKP